MKRNVLKSIALVSSCVFFQSQLLAQGGASDLMRGGIADANTALNGYLGPWAKAFGAGLNSGWYNTAKPHGTGGFDVTVSFNAAFAPSSDQTFNMTGFNNFVPQSGQPTTSPTIFGAASNGPWTDVRIANPLYGINPGSSKDTAITKFQMPQGTGINFFPVPTAQIAVGIYKNTEVIIRYMPAVNAGGISVGLWGFGIKHDFKQWIPAIKEMPFDLSGLFGFTTFNASYALGDNGLKPDADAYNGSGASFNNQKISISSTGWTVQALISKKLLFFTPYLGVGYGYSKTDIAMQGNYPVSTMNTTGTPLSNPNFGRKEVLVLQDPVTITGNASSFRATVGFRLKLLLLTIHGDYTFAAYNVATVGVGLNLQSIVPFKL